MSVVNVTNVVVRCPNPARLDADFAFEVTFTCLEDLQEPLQWRLIYVGSADDKEKDQELECVELGPVKRGALKFTFESDPPNLALIDPDDLWGTTVILLEASYKDQDFIRVGWYVHNVYADPALQDDPPDEPEPEKMVRYIVADEPRVTRFNINWKGPAAAGGEQTTTEYDRQAMFSALQQQGNQQPMIPPPNGGLPNMGLPSGSSIPPSAMPPRNAWNTDMTEEPCLSLPSNKNVWEPVNASQWTKLSEKEWLSDTWLATLTQDTKLVFVNTSDSSIWELAPATDPDQPQQIRKLVTEEALSSDGEELDDDDFALDLSKDFSVKMFSLAANEELECEDLCTPRQSIPLDAIAHESVAGCHLYALYDGSLGRRCADFAASKLGAAILSSFKSIYPTMKDKPSSRGFSEKSWDTLDPRFEEDVRSLPDHELGALLLSVKKGVIETDKNWVNAAAKVNHPDGATMAGLILYGPDQEGALKLISFNLGDTQTILLAEARDPQSLTATHTISDPQERQRFAEGESTSAKLIRSHPNATRALGFIDTKVDRAKKPFRRPTLSSVPHVSFRTVDFSRDNCVLMGTASFWAYVTGTQAAEHLRCEMRREFEKFIDDARDRFPKDDVSDVESWFAAESSKWLKDHSFSQSLSSLCKLARSKGAKDDISVMLCVCAWRPIESFVGGEEELKPTAPKKARQSY